MSLRQTVRGVIADTDNLDTEHLAAVTFAAIPSEDREAALSEALPSFIRDVITATRATINRQADAAAHSEHASPDGHTSPAEANVAPRSIVPAPRRGNPSAKVAAIRDHWRRQLDAIYPDASGVNRRLADFTSDDLNALANRCEEMAAANNAKAKRWRALADLLDRAGVSTLGAAPDDELQDALAA